MANTRVEKYKIYRESIAKKADTSFETPKKVEPRNTEIAFNTTSSLPLDQVMVNYQEKNEQEVVFYKKRRNKLIRQVVIISLIAAAVIGLLVFLLIKALEG